MGRLLKQAMRTAFDALTRASRSAGRRPPPSSSTRDVDASADAVVFEYSPELDGDPDPGEVVWTWIPYEENPRRGKDRPAVIVGRRGAALVGVPLTSKRHDDEPQVAVGTGSWDHQGRPSFAKLDRLLEIRPADVRREGAVLARARYDEVVAGVKRLHQG
jgi:hypothetical protein